MNPSKAQRFLALLQRSAHGHHDLGAITEQAKAAMREIVISRGYPADLVDEAAEEFSFNPDTPFQLSEDRTIIPLLMEELETGIRGCGQESALLPAERPVLGTLRTGQVNAMTIKVPGTNEFVVALDNQLFIFANLICKIIVPALRTTAGDFDFDYERLERRIVENQEISELFVELVLGFAQQGRVAMRRPYVVDPNQAEVAGYLERSMELFIIGHEYGHVVNGDLNDSSEHVRRAVASHDVETLDYSWRQEFKADQHGLTVSILSIVPSDTEAARRQAGSLVFASGGGDLFFTAIDIMDRATSLLRTGDETRLTIGSHPPAAQRRTAHREHLKILMRQFGVPDEHVEPLLRFSKCLERTAEHLWDQARPLIAQAHESGVRPAADWQQITR